MRSTALRKPYRMPLRASTAGGNVYPQRLLARVLFDRFQPCRARAARAGLTTVLVNYSLCPRVGIADIVQQVRKAVAWVASYIGRYGGNSSRMAIGGHSAGAHLAAMCLQTRWQEEFALPRDLFIAAILLSGIYDLEPLRHRCFQPVLRLDDSAVAACSPLFGVRACEAQALIGAGRRETEEFRRQFGELRGRIRCSGRLGRASSHRRGRPILCRQPVRIA